MESEELTGDWVVISTSGGERYIGKKTEESGDFYKLSPVYEYISMIQEGRTPDGKPAMGRVRFCSVLDDNIHQTTLLVHLFGAKMFFITDLHPDDQEKYKVMVRDAEKRVEMMRASKAGIELVGADAMPRRGIRGA